MNRTPIDSSNLVSAGYDADEAVLEVEFRGGAVYRYLEVGPEKAGAFMASESKGSFLAHEIRGVHEHQRVEAEG